MLVDDHQVHGQALHPPVFVGAQQLPHLGDVFGVTNAQQNDRQVAGNPLGPQPGLAAEAAQQAGRRCAKTRVGIQDWCRQALKVGGFGGEHVEVAQLHLGLGPGQGFGALEGAAVVVLVDQIKQRLTGRRHHRPERHTGNLAGLDQQTLAQREDRVQHRADGIR